MADFATLRRAMVDGQVRTADVTDRSIINAMLTVPRERFVAPAQAELAYLDLDLPVGTRGRRLLMPMILAKMLQALQLTQGARVLDVGCATGYAAALMAELGAQVVALEEEPDLLAEAKANLAGRDTVTVVQGRLADGHAAGGPYDAILLEGATEEAPEALFRQLAEGGCLIAIRGAGPAAKVVLYRRDLDDFTPWPVFDAAGAVLPGFARPPAFTF
jgi:protein-L-isoaspartate(D-aspartate) O-methyltransferase